ncbi:hypothetical protein DUNSADRAFT_3337 [Dunaliella salina]|uniref:Uncharacterized protein n=1 Tax=Dunaliella salina TaxID=3046 RepID=A0ABQ7GU55_DUNSA|nr:hypothetical protein DUNSADRAFT_3337 [Dunaliella salina]|eukprot:KAF5838142.1 hypothetical protein DUNSADRAFT_3337 [Dunaliella salina]
MLHLTKAASAAGQLPPLLPITTAALLIAAAARTAAAAAYPTGHNVGAELPAKSLSEGSQFSAQTCSEPSMGTCSSAAVEGCDGSLQANMGGVGDSPTSRDSPAAQKKLLLLLVLLIGAVLTVRTLLALARQWRMSADSPASLSPRPSATPSNSNACDGEPPLKPSSSLQPSSSAAHTPLHSPTASSGLQPASTTLPQSAQPFSSARVTHPTQEHHSTSTSVRTPAAPAAPLQNFSPFQNPSSNQNLLSPKLSGSSCTSGGAADEATGAHTAHTFLVFGARVLDAVLTSTLSLLTLILHLVSDARSLLPHHPLLSPVSGIGNASEAAVGEGLGLAAAPGEVGVGGSPLAWPVVVKLLLDCGCVVLALSAGGLGLWRGQVHTPCGQAVQAMVTALLLLCKSYAAVAASAVLPLPPWHALSCLCSLFTACVQPGSNPVFVGQVLLASCAMAGAHWGASALPSQPHPFLAAALSATAHVLTTAPCALSLRALWTCISPSLLPLSPTLTPSALHGGSSRAPTVPICANSHVHAPFSDSTGMQAASGLRYFSSPSPQHKPVAQPQAESMTSQQEHTPFGGSMVSQGPPHGLSQASSMTVQQQQAPPFGSSAASMQYDGPSRASGVVLPQEHEPPFGSSSIASLQHGPSQASGAILQQEQAPPFGSSTASLQPPHLQRIREDEEEGRWGEPGDGHKHGSKSGLSHQPGGSVGHEFERGARQAGLQHPSSSAPIYKLGMLERQKRPRDAFAGFNQGHHRHHPYHHYLQQQQQQQQQQQRLPQQVPHHFSAPLEHQARQQQHQQQGAKPPISPHPQLSPSYQPHPSNPWAGINTGSEVAASIHWAYAQDPIRAMQELESAQISSVSSDPARAASSITGTSRTSPTSPASPTTPLTSEAMRNLGSAKISSMSSDPALGESSITGTFRTSPNTSSASEAMRNLGSAQISSMSSDPALAASSFTGTSRTTPQNSDVMRKLESVQHESALSSDQALAGSSITGTSTASRNTPYTSCTIHLAQAVRGPYSPPVAGYSLIPEGGMQQRHEGRKLTSNPHIQLVRPQHQQQPEMQREESWQQHQLHQAYLQQQQQQQQLRARGPSLSWTHGAHESSSTPVGELGQRSSRLAPSQMSSTLQSLSKDVQAYDRWLTKIRALSSASLQSSVCEETAQGVQVQQQRQLQQQQQQQAGQNSCGAKPERTGSSATPGQQRTLGNQSPSDDDFFAAMAAAKARGEVTWTIFDGSGGAATALMAQDHTRFDP